MSANDILVDVVYGFIRLDSGLTRDLPDGSIEFGCRVRKYDNKPSEPEHLVSDEIIWSGNVLRQV